MVSYEKILEFSKKTDAELKQEITEQMEKLKDLSMPDEEKMKFVLNRLFAHYSKSVFGGGNKVFFKGFFLGDYGRSDSAQWIRKDMDEFIKSDKEKAKLMNMIDNKGNYLHYEIQAKLEKMEDWQIKKKFREIDPNNAELSDDERKQEMEFYMNSKLELNGKKYVGLKVPENDWTRMRHGFLNIEGKWIRFCMKSSYTIIPNEENKKTDNTIITPLPFQMYEFPAFKVDKQSDDSFYYLTDSGEFELKIVEEELPDSLIEKIINGMPKKIKTLSEFSDYEGKIKKSDYVIIKARVQDISLLKSENYSLNVYDDTLNVGEKDENGNMITPISVYPQEGFKPQFEDGAEIYIFGAPYINKKGTKVIPTCGIYVPSVYKNSVTKAQKIEL